MVVILCVEMFLSLFLIFTLASDYLTLHQICPRSDLKIKLKMNNRHVNEGYVTNYYCRFSLKRNTQTKKVV